MPLAYDDIQQSELQSKIIDLFHQSIEAKMACGEQLAPYIEQASTLIVSHLLNEGRLFCCGNGVASNLASILVQKLSLQYEMERPGFAAILLAPDISVVTATLQQKGLNNLYAHQIDTLACENDILVVFSHGDSPGNIVKAIQAAHEKNMAVISFSATGDENITASLGEQDCQLYIENSDQRRVSEIHLLSLYALCELIDYQLFGALNS